MIAGTAHRDRVSTSTAKDASVRITTHANARGHGNHGTCIEMMSPDENTGHSLFSAANR